jgi:DNA-binding LacI/PurR family transcriptional regulator
MPRIRPATSRACLLIGSDLDHGGGQDDAPEVGLGSQLPAAEIQQLAREVPTVVAGRRVDSVDWVAVDDTAGAALATERLISLGHRRIAHIDGGGGAGAALRREQFLTTMSCRLARQATVVDGDYTESGGRFAGRHLLTAAHPPAAIFAANDLSALGCWQRPDPFGCARLTTSLIWMSRPRD